MLSIIVKKLKTVFYLFYTYTSVVEFYFFVLFVCFLVVQFYNVSFYNEKLQLRCSLDCEIKEVIFLEYDLMALKH